MEGEACHRKRRGAVRCLRVTTALVFTYLCAGELLPLPRSSAKGLLRDWAAQQAVIVATLSVLAILLASTGCSQHAGFFVRLRTAEPLLAALNGAPLAAAAAASLWGSRRSDNCQDDEPGCGSVSMLLDAVGLISARLARLDLGVCLLLAGRGESAWVFGASGGELGYSEAIPLHRASGWWCARQSALHSIAYLLFYLSRGGTSSLWLDCFPFGSTPGSLNTLGLVNFIGIVAALVLLLPLTLSALPHVRKKWYQAFQRLHLPAAMVFVSCCALHDLPILLFAVPGLAGWYLGRQDGSALRNKVLPAKARLLPGTSGTWVELTIDAATVPKPITRVPREEWVSVSVAPLGTESHPLSVTVSATGSTELSMIVSSNIGNWTRALCSLASTPGGDRFDVQVSGPYPYGGGCCCWLSGSEQDTHGREETALLLLAGGTGITGWLPVLAQAGGAHRDPCHLVWFVQKEADYLALANRLPAPSTGVKVTVFVTKADGSALSGKLGKLFVGRARGGAAVVSGVGNGETAQARAHLHQGGNWWMKVALLASTLVGLAVTSWGWTYHHRIWGSSTTLAKFFVAQRCLPVVLVFLAITGVLRAVSWVAVRHYNAVRTGGHQETVDASDLQPLRQDSLIEGAEGLAEAGGHHVHAARPDVSTLVRTAVTEWATHRLVVEARGPPSLVEAARKAVEVEQAKCPCGRLKFHGSDWRW